eukprot:TRINITY_DN936_c0_g3_i1.p2 TRINITY_DN936_c0_g3~~TRINITY_DN936_c0_g3_i1.p2  ORF type:complete len:126 (-),score=0.54 TRINITY_DN936_c0_g3_i1:12-389(-)
MLQCIQADSTFCTRGNAWLNYSNSGALWCINLTSHHFCRLSAECARGLTMRYLSRLSDMPSFGATSSTGACTDIFARTGRCRRGRLKRFCHSHCRELRSGMSFHANVKCNPYGRGNTMIASATTN